MHMRPALRECREHGETIVAWAAVETVPDLAATTLLLGLAMLPLVGGPLGSVVFRARRCVLVLTDQRLLLVGRGAGRGGTPHRLLPDFWFTSLGVRRLGRESFALRSVEGGREIRVCVQRPRGRGARRMLEALGELARV